MKSLMFPLVRRFAIVLACLAAVQPARAGMDIDFGAAVDFGSDTDLFVRISSRYFERARPVVDTWGQRFANPDDLAVFLFLSRHSGKSPDAVFALRQQGHTWFEIGLRVGVPVGAWFVPVDTEPKPPFGKAYGRFKKHKKQRGTRMRLSDSDCRNLVSVRVLHEYFGLGAEEAMALRSAGGDVSVLVRAQYAERHGKGMAAGRWKPAAPRGN